MNSCSLENQTVMWSLEVSLRFWAEGRTVWSLSSCPPCCGFCCLFAALQSRTPCPGCWEGEGLPWGTEPQSGHWKHGPSSAPRTDHLGRIPGGISGYSMARPTLLGAGAFISFLWAPFCSQSKAPTARPPALNCSRMGLARATEIKMKGRLGEKNYNNKNPPLFAY